MRPKIVLLTLVAAFGLLGLVAVIKGMAGKHAADSGAPDSAVGVPPDSSNTNTGTQAPTTAISSSPVSDQMRAAILGKEMEQIQQLQGGVDGTNNPIIIAALLEKGMNSDADVRKAAVEALRQMNDTNAIPGLEKLAAGIQDAREKVAVLDAIDYLKLPNIMPDEMPPGMSTNEFGVSKIPDDKMNQNFMKSGGKKKPKRQADRNSTQNPPATQPQ